MRSFEVIPAIDLHGGRCVRLVRGDFAAETVYGDDPVAMAERWAGEGGERLHVVDLDGAARGARTHGSVIARICSAIDVPVQVGGGLRDIGAVASVLEAGADRAILGTAAVERPELVEEACRRFPGCIAVGIDQRAGKVATAGWLSATDLAPRDVVRRLAAVGVVAIIYTDIARDGTGAGANLDATVELATGHAVPLIVSGGVASLEDVRRARAAYDRGANLSGVIIGRALYEGAIRLADAVAVGRGEC